MTKILGVPLLLTGRLAKALPDQVGLCALGTFRVKGRQEGLEVYTHCTQSLDEWDTAMAAIRDGDIRRARWSLERIGKTHPLGGAARFYLKLLEEWGDLTPMDWDGVVTLETK